MRHETRALVGGRCPHLPRCMEASLVGQKPAMADASDISWLQKPYHGQADGAGPPKNMYSTR